MEKEEPFDFMEFEKTVGPEGVPVFVKRLPWVHGWVTVKAVLGVGARQDPQGKEGLAHFIEHMLFEGTLQFQTPGEIDELKKKVFSGSLNAGTSMEHTIFGGRVPRERLPRAMKILRELIFHPLLRQEDFEKERSIIPQEILNHVPNDNAAALIRAWRRDLYHNHPFGRTWLASGWSDTVSTIRHEDIVGFHKQYYHLGNISLMFVGDITMTEALRFAEIFAKGVPRQYGVVSPAKLLAWPGPLRTRFEVSLREAYQTQQNVAQRSTIYVMRVVPRQYNPQSLLVFNEMVYWLLHDFVRTKLGVSYGVSAVAEHARDHSLWKMEIGVRADALNEVEAKIREVIADFYQPGKHEKLFEDVKKRIAEELQGLELTSCAISDMACYEVAMEGNISTVRENQHQLEAVTYRDVVELARREFAPHLLYWHIVRP